MHLGMGNSPNMKHQASDQSESPTKRLKENLEASNDMVGSESMPGSSENRGTVDSSSQQCDNIMQTCGAQPVEPVDSLASLENKRAVEKMGRLETLKREIKALEEDEERVSYEKHQMLQELEKTKERNRTLESEISSMKSKTENSAHDLNNTRAMLKTLQRQNKWLEDHTKVVDERLLEGGKERESQTKQLGSLETEVRTLREQLKPVRHKYLITKIEMTYYQAMYDAKIADQNMEEAREKIVRRNKNLHPNDWMAWAEWHNQCQGERGTSDFIDV